VSSSVVIHGQNASCLLLHMHAAHAAAMPAATALTALPACTSHSQPPACSSCCRHFCPLSMPLTLRPPFLSAVSPLARCCHPPLPLAFPCLVFLDVASFSACRAFAAERWHAPCLQCCTPSPARARPPATHAFPACPTAPTHTTPALPPPHTHTCPPPWKDSFLAALPRQEVVGRTGQWWGLDMEELRQDLPPATPVLLSKDHCSPRLLACVALALTVATACLSLMPLLLLMQPGIFPPHTAFSAFCSPRSLLQPASLGMDFSLLYFLTILPSPFLEECTCHHLPSLPACLLLLRFACCCHLLTATAHHASHLPPPT